MLEARTRAPSFDPQMERLPPPLSPPADKSPRAQRQLLADRNNVGPRHPSGLGHARGTKMRQACNAKGHAGRQSNSGAVIPTRQATPLGTTLPPRVRSKTAWIVSSSETTTIESTCLERILRSGSLSASVGRASGRERGNFGRRREGPCDQARTIAEICNLLTDISLRLRPFATLPFCLMINRARLTTTLRRKCGLPHGQIESSSRRRVLKECPRWSMPACPSRDASITAPGKLFSGSN